jgi:hypothetical protein
VLDELRREAMAAVAERSHADILSDTPVAPDQVSVTMPRAWLELNKRCGPKRDLQLSEPNLSRAAEPVRPKKRGRPTKLEQMRRQSAAFPLRFER